MKVLLFANTDWYLYNFRLSLAKRLREEGCNVVLVVPPGAYVAKLRDAGFDCITVDVRRRSLNPLGEVRLLYQLIKVYRQERPDVAHHFTIKSILYGSLAAKVAGTGLILNEFTGLGIIYTSRNPLFFAIRRILKPVLAGIFRSGAAHAVVQNERDKTFVAHRFRVPDDRLHLVRGSGVDVNRFVPTLRNGDAGRTPTVLMACRLIRKKGILDLMAAAKLLRQHNVSADFMVAGAVDPGNPDSLTEDELARLRREKSVRFLGHIDDMVGLLARSDIAVLPSSYGEGIPKFLVEAASAGVPIVTTNVPGCRDVVEDGVNGLIVPPGDVAKLADALRQLAEHHDLRQRMGIAGRRKAEREFDQELVLMKILGIYDRPSTRLGEQRAAE